MSGAVNTVKKTVEDVVEDVKNIPKQPLKSVAGIYSSALMVPATGIYGSITGATGTARGAAQGAVTGEGVVPGAAKGFRESGSMNVFMGQPNVPNIAVQDPNAVAQQQAREKDAAMRRAQVDQMTSTPGRGGTILTDNYTYRT